MNECHTAKFWAPSNIALVKYWGKKDFNLAQNPSVSFTLNIARTETELSWTKKSSCDSQNDAAADLVYFFEGRDKPGFTKKILSYLSLLKREFPKLSSYKLKISSHNTFPHSAGLASSASSMAALSLCLSYMKESLEERSFNAKKLQNQISAWARLGSGSASRSVISYASYWEGEYAREISNLNLIFKTFQDTILIVSEEEKNLSSSLGHELMNKSSYSAIRFERAKEHAKMMLDLLTTPSTSLKCFIDLVECEALELHAMILSSNYLLLASKTLSIIESVRNFRDESSVPLCFTLDAGSSVHLLYPLSEKEKVHYFIKEKLSPHFKFAIFDEVGKGPIC